MVGAAGVELQRRCDLLKAHATEDLTCQQHLLHADFLELVRADEIAHHEITSALLSTPGCRGGTGCV
jgi:hypothetical protein